MFKFLMELVGPHERGALRRGAVWAGIAFVPGFAMWAAQGCLRAAVVEGLLFASLVFPAGLATGLLSKEQH